MWREAKFTSRTVEKYFPEVNLIPKKYSWSPPITLVQVATMSAGLQATPSTVGGPYATGSPSDWQKQLISALPHIEYVYEPGTRRLYSNISYSILAAALERAAGKPYIDYVQETILRPLGMTSTSFFVTPDLAPRIAKGYYLGHLSCIHKINAATETPTRSQRRGTRRAGMFAPSTDMSWPSPPKTGHHHHPNCSVYFVPLNLPFQQRNSG